MDETIQITLATGEVTTIDKEFAPLADRKWMRNVSKDKVYAVRFGSLPYDPTKLNKHGKPKRNRAYIQLHREIIGALPGQSVDHINGDTLDNRLCNLRICNNRENNRNARPRTPGYKGVSKHHCSERWIAKMQPQPGVYWHLGCLKSPEDAAWIYNQFASITFGEFAWLNELPEGFAPSDHATAICASKMIELKPKLIR